MVKPSILKRAIPYALVLSQTLLVACGGSSAKPVATPPEHLTELQIAARVVASNPAAKAAVGTALSQRNANATAGVLFGILEDPTVAAVMAKPMKTAVIAAATAGNIELTPTDTPRPKLTSAQVAGTAGSGNDVQSAINRVIATQNAPTIEAQRRAALSNPTVQSVSTRAVGTALAQASAEGRIDDKSTPTSAPKTATVSPTAPRTPTALTTISFTGTVGGRIITVTTSPNPTSSPTPTPPGTS